MVCVSRHFGINDFMFASGHSRLFAASFVNMPVWSRKDSFGRGANDIHKSTTEIPGCGLGCLQVSQTSSNSGFAVD